MRWILGLAATAVLVTGCATANLALSPQERMALRIESVKVEYVKEAHIWWGNGEREYLARTTAASTQARTKKATGEVAETDSATKAQEIMASPEAQDYLRTKLASMIETAVAAKVKPAFNGSRPVRLEIQVHSFVIPSAAQRAVLGGAPTLGAVTYLKDARTGAELGKLDRGAIAGAGSGVIGVLVDQGLDDLEDRVINVYTTQVLDWLRAGS